MKSALSELVARLHKSVQEDDAWSALRMSCEPAAAIDAFVKAKCVPLTKQPAEAFADNAPLSEALRQLCGMCDELEQWPGGVGALAQMQSSPLDLFLQSTSVTFESAVTFPRCTPTPY